MTTVSNNLLIGRLAQSSLTREIGTGIASSLLVIGSQENLNSLGLLRNANPIPSLPTIQRQTFSGLEDFISKSVPNSTQLLKDLSTVVALGSLEADAYLSPQAQMTRAAYLYQAQDFATKNSFRNSETLLNSLL